MLNIFLLYSLIQFIFFHSSLERLCWTCTEWNYFMSSDFCHWPLGRCFDRHTFQSMVGEITSASSCRLLRLSSGLAWPRQSQASAPYFGLFLLLPPSTKSLFLYNATDLLAFFLFRSPWFCSSVYLAFHFQFFSLPPELGCQRSIQPAFSLYFIAASRRWSFLARRLDCK